MYCGTNTSVFGAVYSKSPMLTTDGLTIYNKDYYAPNAVSDTHLRAQETLMNLVCSVLR